jgi:hypothetical protein
MSNNAEASGIRSDSHSPVAGARTAAYQETREQWRQISCNFSLQKYWLCSSSSTVSLSEPSEAAVHTCAQQAAALLAPVPSSVPSTPTITPFEPVEPLDDRADADVYRVGISSMCDHLHPVLHDIRGARQQLSASSAISSPLLCAASDVTSVAPLREHPQSTVDRLEPLEDTLHSAQPVTITFPFGAFRSAAGVNLSDFLAVAGVIHAILFAAIAFLILFCSFNFCRLFLQQSSQFPPRNSSFHLKLIPPPETHPST